MLTRVSHSIVKLLRVVWVLANLWVTGGVTGINQVILCSGLSQQENIQCPREYVIDVSSVTVATLSEIRTCSTNLMRLIDISEKNHCPDYSAKYTYKFLADQEKQCKSSTGDSGRYEVFRRCQGNQRCSVDGSVVDNLFFGTYCLPNMRVVWFNYSCRYVNSSLPSVALLPIPQGKVVQGFEVDIFSPYYPCFRAKTNKVTSLQCRIIPKRQYFTNLISYVLKVKKVEIRRGLQDCGDFLTFRLGVKIQKNYCGHENGEIEFWNEDIVFHNTTENLNINYQTRPTAGGARFWLIAKAVEDTVPIEVSLSCIGQEEILTLSSSCTPIVSTSKMKKITTDNDQNITKGNIGLRIGLGFTAAFVVIETLVVFAIIIYWKLRKWKSMVEEGTATTNDPHTDPTVTPDAHGSEPDDIANTENAHEPTYPVMYTTPINITTNTGPYEEVEQRGAAPNSSTAPTGKYENISPNNTEYESLKRVTYENTPVIETPKIYTGLERTKRQSKV